MSSVWEKNLKTGEGPVFNQYRCKNEIPGEQVVFGGKVFDSHYQTFWHTIHSKDNDRIVDDDDLRDSLKQAKKIYFLTKNEMEWHRHVVFIKVQVFPQLEVRERGKYTFIISLGDSPQKYFDIYKRDVTWAWDEMIESTIENVRLGYEKVKKYFTSEVQGCTVNLIFRELGGKRKSESK